MHFSIGSQIAELSRRKAIARGHLNQQLEGGLVTEDTLVAELESISEARRKNPEAFWGSRQLQDRFAVLVEYAQTRERKGVEA